MKRIKKGASLFLMLFVVGCGALWGGRKSVVHAEEVDLVRGESVQYMGYSTHYYYVNGNLAYCLEPDRLSPGSGGYPSEGVDPDQLLGKAMYYVYGGPGFEAYMKPTLTGGWDQKDRSYCLSHCILSYIYDGCDMNSAGFIGLNEDIKKAVVQYTDAIRNWPGVPKTDISLSDTDLTAFFCKEEKNQRTKSITCNGDSTNSLVFSLPEGVSLVNETRKVQETQTAQVRGGEQFYLAADVAFDNGGVWESGQMKGTLDQAWRTLVVKTGDSSQDVGGGYLVKVEPGTVSMKVKWVEKPELTVKKTADKADKTYQVGDVITYTMDVTQQIKDAVAKNVVITDTILTKGVKLQKNSIVLLDADHSVISDAVISTTENSFTIHAGEFLQSIETGEKYTVEYQVVIIDQELIGKEIENEVVVRADNAEEKEDDEIVKVEEPKEEPKEPEKPQITTPEKPKEDRPVLKKAETVKTGDNENLMVLILLVILSCAAVIICGRIASKTKKQ